MKYDIFISYSRNDSKIVNAFVHSLEKAGYKVWMDRKGIYSGSQFKKDIVNAIAESSVFLFFSSQSANSSEWTAKEIGIANTRGKTIIPIKLDHSGYNEEVEFDLVNLDFVDYTNEAKHQEEFKKLMLSLGEHLDKEIDPQKLKRVIKEHESSKNGIKKYRGWIVSLLLLSSVIVTLAGAYYTYKSYVDNQPAQVSLEYVSSDKTIQADSIKFFCILKALNYHQINIGSEYYPGTHPVPILKNESDKSITNFRLEIEVLLSSFYFKEEEVNNDFEIVKRDDILNTVTFRYKHNVFPAKSGITLPLEYLYLPDNYPFIGMPDYEEGFSLEYHITYDGIAEPMYYIVQYTAYCQEDNLYDLSNSQIDAFLTKCYKAKRLFNTGHSLVAIYYSVGKVKTIDPIEHPLTDDEFEKWKANVIRDVNQWDADYEAKDSALHEEMRRNFEEE